MLRSRYATLAGTVALFALALGACTTDPTEVIVRVSTDAPPGRAMTVTATVHQASNPGGAGQIRSWTRAVDGGMHAPAGSTITFPATFAIVPAADQPRDEEVVLVLDAVLAPANLGDPPVQFRRIARFQFVPHRRTTLNIFLALGCGNAATDCTTVPASRCTVSVACEEQGRTCGDHATCVSAVTQPTTDDASTGDATAMSDVVPDLVCPATCPNAANARGQCIAGICTLRCDPNFEDCDGNAANGCEINLLTSTSNCGNCGRACPVGQFCATGTCIANCLTGQTACGGGCVTLTTDTQNCGTCGNICPTPANGISTCAMGMCGIRCNPGFADCNHMAADGCETNILTSVGNCGSCGTVCTGGGSSTPMCVAGSCGIACAPGRADCDHLSSNGCEVDTTTSTANCGACGHTCPNPANATGLCSSSVCGITCTPGFGNCDGNDANGCETNLNTDAAHCGACATACPTEANSTPGCTMGACDIRCNAGFGNCDGNPANGCETNLTNTLASCGSCGAVCMPAHATPVCAGGACSIAACAPMYFDLNANPADGCECLTDSWPTACGSAASVGMIAIGASTTVSGNVVPATDSDWFVVSFVAGGHPSLSVTGGFLLQVQAGCGMSESCMDGVADAVTTWEFYDTPAVPAHTTRTVTAPTMEYFRVYSTGPVTCTNYTVTVSN
jgi:hypothetical protein